MLPHQGAGARRGGANPGRIMNTPTSSHDISLEDAHKYWRDNRNLMLLLLAIWFIVSFGFGIIFRDVLDQFRIGGAPLGFWFAQQGSIYVFVVLIFVYCFRMSALERKYGIKG